MVEVCALISTLLVTIRLSIAFYWAAPHGKDMRGRNTGVPRTISYRPLFPLGCCDLLPSGRACFEPRICCRGSASLQAARQRLVVTALSCQYCQYTYHTLHTHRQQLEQQKISHSEWHLTTNRGKCAIRHFKIYESL